MRRWCRAASSWAAYARTAPSDRPMPRPYFLVSSRRLMSLKDWEMRGCVGLGWIKGRGGQLGRPQAARARPTTTPPTLPPQVPSVSLSHQGLKDEAQVAPVLKAGQQPHAVSPPRGVCGGQLVADDGFQVPRARHEVIRPDDLDRDLGRGSCRPARPATRPRRPRPRVPGPQHGGEHALAVRCKDLVPPAHDFANLAVGLGTGCQGWNVSGEEWAGPWAVARWRPRAARPPTARPATVGRRPAQHGLSALALTPPLAHLEVIVSVGGVAGLWACAGAA